MPNPRLPVKWQKKLLYVMLNHNILLRPPEDIYKRITPPSIASRNCKRFLKTKYF